MANLLPQVELSNTFNEFRSTVNNISNTINGLIDPAGGPGDYSTESLYADGVYANTVTTPVLSATSATAPNTFVSTLTSGRVVVAGASGKLIDDAGLTYNTSTNALTVDGDLNINGNNIRFHSANGSATFANTTYALEVHGRRAHMVSENLVITETASWISSRNETEDQHLVLAIGDTDGSHDIAVVNKSTGANAYGEFIAYSTTGNSEAGWLSMGINSPNYTQSAFSLTGPDEAYMLYEAEAGTTGTGNLIIGTGSNGSHNKIILAAGGFTDPANNQQIVITPGERVYVNINTQSSNTSTGALVVNGGIGLNGNLNVGGNVAITGTITLGGGGNTVSTSSLQVDNPIIFVGSNNAADTFDLGINGEYTSTGTKYSGLVRDASDSGKWKLYSGITDKPANTVNFTGATYDTLYLGKVEAVGNVASSSTTTGTIIVTGGVGVSGAIYAGGQVQTSGQIRTTATTASTSTSSGALVVDGGAGVAGALYVGGVANFAGKTTIAATTKLQQILEKSTVTATAATGTINYNALDQAVLYYTSNSSGNFTMNIRGDGSNSLDSIMATGESLTLAFLNTNGGTGYYQTGFQIDGNSVTPKWQGGTAPSSGNASSIDIYSYTVIKTGAATFTVLASQTKFA